MNYGTKMIEDTIFCANCGRIVSTNGVNQDNFCFVCGNPLTLKGIEAKEQEIAEIKGFLKK